MNRFHIRLVINHVSHCPNDKLAHDKILFVPQKAPIFFLILSLAWVIPLAPAWGDDTYWNVSIGYWDDDSNWTNLAPNSYTRILDGTTVVTTYIDNGGTVLNSPISETLSFYTIDIGYNNSGTVSLSNSITAQGITTYIGTNTASTGLLILDASYWYAYGEATIGYSGTGTLDIQNGGYFSATNLTVNIATLTGSIGILNIGAYDLSNPTTGGTFDAASVVFGAGTGVINFNQTDTRTFTATISGNGSIAQRGSGTTILTGDNTYTGTTTISDGTLQVGDGGTSGSLGSSNVVDNAALVFDRSDTITVSNVISGTGTLTQTGSGTTILTGNNTYTGTTTISDGTLQVGDGGTSGSLGSGNVVDNTALVFDRSDTITVSNVISGTGTLTQTGSGTTVLTANNTYTGNTTIEAGTMLINGSLESSTVTVNTAILGGDGTINGAVIVNNGGTLSPGSSLSSNSTAILTVSSLTLNIGSTTVMARPPEPTTTRSRLPAPPRSAAR